MAPANSNSVVSAASLCLSLLASTAPGNRIAAGRAGEYNRILTIPVKINGKGPYRFFVDTGATTTAIGARFAETLRLEEGTSASAAGATGTITAKRLIMPMLEIGAVKLSDVKAIAAQNFDELQAIAPDVVGSLGINAFQSKTLVLDFQRNVVALTDERIPNDAGIPVEIGRGMYIPTYLNGTGPIRMYLDTGAEVNMISEALAKRLGLQEFADRPMTGAGGSGISTVTGAVVRSFIAGNRERTDVAVTISDQVAALAAATRTPFEGIAGYPIFGGDCAAIDFVGGRAIF